MNRLKSILAFLLLVILWLLVGCAILEPRIVTQEVAVPVMVQCVEEIPKPPLMATDSLQQGDSIGAKVQALVIDHKSLEADNKLLRALLAGCV